MGDEQEGQAEIRLHAGQEIEDLSLDRQIQGRDRLVADHEFRLEDERAGNSDPLALAAREFVRIAVQRSPWQADTIDQRLDAALAHQCGRRCHGPEAARSICRRRNGAD